MIYLSKNKYLSIVVFNFRIQQKIVDIFLILISLSVFVFFIQKLLNFLWLQGNQLFASVHPGKLFTFHIWNFNFTVLFESSQKESVLRKQPPVSSDKAFLTTSIRSLQFCLMNLLGASQEFKSLTVVPNTSLSTPASVVNPSANNIYKFVCSCFYFVFLRVQFLPL